MRYTVPIVFGVFLVALIIFVTFSYNLGDVVPTNYPKDIVGKNMDAHAVTAGALQETAGLLTTISLALAAVFGFSVASYFEIKDHNFYVGVILSALFAICLVLVFLYAYGTYRAIAIQTDQGVFFAEIVGSFLTTEALWMVGCSIITIFAFCWRCFNIQKTI